MVVSVVRLSHKNVADNARLERRGSEAVLAWHRKTGARVGATTVIVHGGTSVLTGSG